MYERGRKKEPGTTVLSPHNSYPGAREAVKIKHSCGLEHGSSRNVFRFYIKWK